MLSLVCLDGSSLHVHPDFVESVRPGNRGVLVRLINGITEVVEGPYKAVLDLLAEAVSSIKA